MRGPQEMLPTRSCCPAYLGIPSSKERPGDAPDDVLEAPTEHLKTQADATLSLLSNFFAPLVWAKNHPAEEQKTVTCVRISCRLLTNF